MIFVTFNILIYEVQFSNFIFSDNSHIVVGTEDGEIFIWNIKEKVLHKKFNVHKSTVRAISYSPDGLKLVSCSTDKTFNILDIETGMTLYSKLIDSRLCCLKWCDFMLLFGDEEGVLHVWDIVEVKFMYSKKLHSGNYSATTSNVTVVMG